MVRSSAATNCRKMRPRKSDKLIWKPNVFEFEPQVSDDPNRRFYVAEYPNMTAPPMTPTRSTQIIVVLQFHLTAEKPGEWTVQVNLRLGAGRAFLHRLPAARIAAVRRSWLPIVTGLNPRTTYDTSERRDEKSVGTRHGLDRRPVDE